MAIRSDTVELMIRAARAAGDQLIRDFSRLDTVRVTEKGASDFVSSADLRSQEILQQELSKAFPNHVLHLEEGGLTDTPQGKSCFYVDPLDGTTNFLHGIPHFAVAVGLESVGEVVAGVVLSPATGELFWGEKGRGAWLGDRRLQVSGERDLGRAIVGTGIPHRGGRDHDKYLEALSEIMRDFAGIRRFGAAALDLSFVAAGRFDTFFERGLKPWDIAAGSLFIREAGGVVSHYDGQPLNLHGSDILASSNPALHRDMIQRLTPLHRSAVR